ncbi:BTAD domain-containing putative transcriptional regulator [Kitasatospora misakiensis]|uniref:BTAD domain-containing putative transcriptional regulator n=1 Tax=Kitasatospora misakiensis TaxID=67330 RepID=A0ABW0X1P7_9ACTN
MHLGVLGPVEVRDDEGGIVELPGTKVHTVLATLILAEGQTVSDDRLSSMLWAWDPPTTMSAQIYTYVSRLRKRLGPDVELVRRPRGYQLRADRAGLDLAEFERSAGLGRTALAGRRWAEAARELRAALDLVRGPALTNVTEHLADVERPRLEELHLAALEDWFEAELALGRHHRLVPDLTSLTAEHPMRERTRGQLMTALYRCGRQSDALAVFHAGRRILAEELGVDPGEALAGVHQGVLDGSLARHAPAPAPEPVTLRPAAPAMLPPDLPDFTGRRAELDQLLGLVEPHPIARPRRAFLTGTAGIGKSALAVHAAHRLRERFPDGQLYADLGDGEGGRAKDPAEVLTCFLRALGVEPAGHGLGLDELTRLYRTHSAGRRLLVVLDNAPGTGRLTALMPTGPEAAVIVTSRRHLAGASARDTTVLAPFTADESTALLAAVAGERIAADPRAAREIAAACAGLPLAVRIAGVRLAARPQWSAARLAARLADPATRLDELNFGELRVRDSLLRSLVDVEERARLALPALAAFGTGAFPAEAAARLLRVPEAAAERALEELVDARLLEAAADPARPGGPAYRLPDLVLLLTAGLGDDPRRDYPDPWRGIARAVVNLRPTG